MVETLRLALDKINDDIVFSYSDILYDQNIIFKILKKKITNITVPVNINWKKYGEFEISQFMMTQSR